MHARIILKYIVVLLIVAVAQQVGLDTPQTKIAHHTIAIIFCCLEVCHLRLQDLNLPELVVTVLRDQLEITM